MRLPDLARALSQEWSQLNRNVFGGALLRPPTIEVAEKLHSRLGEWAPETRTIRLSEKFASESPWCTVLEVLKHEMAHQYVADVLGVENEETAHGRAFRMVCDRYGIDGRAAGTPSEEAERIRAKIEKLLALGTSPNEHEAHAALTAARKLLHQHGLSEADLQRDDDEFGALVVGPIVTRRQAHHRYVAALLGSHFRVRPIWIGAADPRTGTAGRQLELVGQRRDLAVAEYVHGWLHQVAERLCPAGLSRKARLDFVAGVIVGQIEKLDSEMASARADSDGHSTALVLSNACESRRDDYFARRHPCVRSSSGRGRRVTGAFFEGTAAGRSLAMQRPLAGAGPKLLGK